MIKNIWKRFDVRYLKREYLDYVTSVLDKAPILLKVCLFVLF